MVAIFVLEGSCKVQSQLQEAVVRSSNGCTVRSRALDVVRTRLDMHIQPVEAAQSYAGGACTAAAVPVRVQVRLRGKWRRAGEAGKAHWPFVYFGA